MRELLAVPDDQRDGFFRRRSLALHPDRNRADNATELFQNFLAARNSIVSGQRRESAASSGEDAAGAPGDDAFDPNGADDEMFQRVAGPGERLMSNETPLGEMLSQHIREAKTAYRGRVAAGENFLTGSQSQGILRSNSSQLADKFTAGAAAAPSSSGGKMTCSKCSQAFSNQHDLCEHEIAAHKLLEDGVVKATSFPSVKEMCVQVAHTLCGVTPNILGPSVAAETLTALCRSASLFPGAADAGIIADLVSLFDAVVDFDQDHIPICVVNAAVGQSRALECGPTNVFSVREPPPNWLYGSPISGEKFGINDVAIGGQAPLFPGVTFLSVKVENYRERPDPSSRNFNCCHCRKAISYWFQAGRRCRQCARSVCDDCCTNRARIPWLGHTRAVRICDTCKTQLPRLYLSCVARSFNSSADLSTVVGFVKTLVSHAGHDAQQEARLAFSKSAVESNSCLAVAVTASDLHSTPGELIELLRAVPAASRASVAKLMLSLLHQPALSKMEAIDTVGRGLFDTGAVEWHPVIKGLLQSQDAVHALNIPFGPFELFAVPTLRVENWVTLWCNVAETRNLSPDAVSRCLQVLWTSRPFDAKTEATAVVRCATARCGRLLLLVALRAHLPTAVLLTEAFSSGKSPQVVSAFLKGVEAAFVTSTDRCLLVAVHACIASYQGSARWPDVSQFVLLLAQPADATVALCHSILKASGFAPVDLVCWWLRQAQDNAAFETVGIAMALLVFSQEDVKAHTAQIANAALRAGSFFLAHDNSQSAARIACTILHLIKTASSSSSTHAWLLLRQCLEKAGFASQLHRTSMALEVLRQATITAGGTLPPRVATEYTQLRASWSSSRSSENTSKVAKMLQQVEPDDLIEAIMDGLHHANAREVLLPLLDSVVSDAATSAASGHSLMLRSFCAALKAAVSTSNLQPLLVAISEHYVQAHRYPAANLAFQRLVDSDWFVTHTGKQFTEDLRTFGPSSTLFCDEVPSMATLDPHTKYMQFFRHSKMIMTVARCERSVLRAWLAAREVDPQAALKAAMAYFNLVGAMPGSAFAAVCIVRAMAFLVESMANIGIGDEAAFSVKEGMIMLLSCLLDVSSREGPQFRFYINQRLLSIVRRCHSAAEWRPIFTVHDGELLQLILCRMATDLPWSPLLRGLPLHASDAVYFGIRCDEVSSDLLRGSEKPTSALQRFLPVHDRMYILLTGILNHWIRNPSTEDVSPSAPPSESTARALVMKALLDEKGWTAADVEACIQVAGVRRLRNGFVDPAYLGSLEPGLNLLGLGGFAVNLETGHVDFHLAYAGPMDTGLISFADIKEIIANRLDQQGVFFTLDQPSDSQRFGTEPWRLHPFQETGFGPASARGTGVLHAMLHADYLLKFFTCGVEVSGIAPFDTRPSSAMMTVLPRDIATLLLQLSHEAGRRPGKCHRFWIDANAINFSATVNGSKQVVDVDKPSMKLKTQLMKPNVRGEFEDAPTADQADDSPEANYARAFTLHYERIAQYVPVFARLRELLRVMAVIRVLRSIFDTMFDRANSRSTVIGEIRVRLVTVKAELCKMYPTSERRISEIVNESVNDACSRARVSRSQVSRSEIASAESTIRDQISENDRNQLAALTNQLNDAHGTSISSGDVQRWLAGGRDIADAIADAQMAKMRDALEPLQKLGFNALPQSSTTRGRCTSVLSNKACCWVPAAVNCGDSRLSYGGVHLGPNLTPGSLSNPLPTSACRMSGETLTCQRNLAIPNSDAQRIDNIRANNEAFFNAQRHSGGCQSNGSGPRFPQSQVNHFNPLTDNPLGQYHVDRSNPSAGTMESTFRSGTYTSRVTTAPEVLYRYDSEPVARGTDPARFYNVNQPQGFLSRAIGNGIMEGFNNTGACVTEIRVPSGTTVYEGISAEQRCPQRRSFRAGGEHQVFIPHPQGSWVTRSAAI